MAGLLAQRHQAKVIAVGEGPTRYRLPRMLDLSVAAITRPETWAVLTATVPETARFIGRLAGRQAIRRVDPIFFADSAAAKESLGHFAHMARGFGQSLEAVPNTRLGAGRNGYRLIDAMIIDRAAFEPSLEAWLAGQAVRYKASQAIEMTPEGSAQVHIDGAVIEARQVVLIDDAAIIEYLPPALWPALLLRQARSTILTVSNRRMAGPLMLDVETGTMLLQHEEDSLVATGPGRLAQLSARLTRLVSNSGQLQQAGQVGFEGLMTLDGAPLLGQTMNKGPIFLTGLGSLGAFLAPMLARWIAGEASSEELEWCQTRRPDRQGRHQAIAEYAGREEHAA
ncbi:hypothetical protein [Devosia soli]|uniref:hypothetical protein n=1 Tax=Devosia soli TaxID=361041 RepID=UPI00128B239D|nr:hypothetical protein [Devosia soli]